MERVDNSDDIAKCWLSMDEIDRLARAAGDGWGWEREIAIELMGYCGLRVSEVNDVTPGDLRWSDDGDIWFLEVKGKNTKGGDPNVRDVWVPDDVQEDLHKYACERGLDDDDPYIDASVRTIRRWAEQAAERVQDDTNNERWQLLSPHDLRRSWATHYLVEEDVDVRTMMAVGGWSSYNAIEPYFKEPTESRIGEAFRDARTSDPR